METRLMTAQEVADWLQMPLSSIYDLTHRRRIPFIKIGSRLRFRADDIDAWLSQQDSEGVLRDDDPMQASL